MADDPTIPEAADLYAVPPGDFVAARNQLVKALRAEGRREDAARVAKLRRPSATAWALNQCARHDPDVIEAAIVAGTDLKRATEAALAGDRAALRDAQQAQRQAIDHAVDASLSHLRGAGATANDQARQRLAGTLRAAASDDAVAADLRAGRLEDDHGATGFGFDLTGLPDVPTGAGEDADRDDAHREKEADIRRQRRAELEDALAGLASRAAELADEARGAEEAAEAARRRADEAEAAVAEARRELEDLSADT